MFLHHTSSGPLSVRKYFHVRHQPYSTAQGADELLKQGMSEEDFCYKAFINQFLIVPCFFHLLIQKNKRLRKNKASLKA